MLKLLRYTLAAIFLAAGVGCLGLWGRSFDPPSSIRYSSATKDWRLLMTVGNAAILVNKRITLPAGTLREGIDSDAMIAAVLEWEIRKSRSGTFGQPGGTICFPLWYPALVFALAAVGVLRLGNAFTIRSALAGTTVVAALLGMVVAL